MQWPKLRTIKLVSGFLQHCSGFFSPPAHAACNLVLRSYETLFICFAQIDMTQPLAI